MNDYQRYLDGDDNGLVRLIETYYAPLAQYLLTYVRDGTLAEELAEDTFVKIAVKKPRFSERSSFKTWLYAIGRHLALDALRRQARHPVRSLEEEKEPSTDGDPTEADFLAGERKAAVRQALMTLPTEYRQVLWLVYFEDMTAADAARVMKRSEAAAEHLIRRARASLREILKEEETL